MPRQAKMVSEDYIIEKEGRQPEGWYPVHYYFDRVAAKEKIVDEALDNDTNWGTTNVGFFNTGLYNIGFSNSGTQNLGNHNHGYRNVGNNNSGVRNVGNYNTGQDCIGDNNAGHQNVGQGNTGWNCVGKNLGGYFNINEPGEIDLTIPEGENSSLYCFNQKVWATEEEAMEAMPSNWNQSFILLQPAKYYNARQMEDIGYVDLAYPRHAGGCPIPSSASGSDRFAAYRRGIEAIARSFHGGGAGFVQHFPRWSPGDTWDWDVFAIITGMTREDIINL